MKYIMLKEAGQYASCHVPILFPAALTHAEVAKHFGGADNVVSAGFVSVQQDGTHRTRGESISLKVSSREEDARHIDLAYKMGAL